MSATNSGGTDAANTTTITVSDSAPGTGMHFYMIDGGVYVPLTTYTLT
jgi:hypothetical protein